MRRDPWADQMDLLINASEEDRERAIRNMTGMDLARFDADFESWAHKNQLPPSGEGWRTWLMMAGRGFGKTRAGSECIFSGSAKQSPERASRLSAARSPRRGW
jgi:phage terminase large subunit-like protein